MEDKRFFTPMITNDCVGQIFVNDFVKVYSQGNLKVAKVKTFFKKVFYQPYNIDICHNQPISGRM